MFYVEINNDLSIVLVESLEGKLIRGNDSVIGNFQYVAALKYFDQHFCNGFLISWGHILSAAQCLEAMLLPTNPQFAHYTAVVGSQDRNAGQTCFFREVEIHEHYTLRSRRPPHDIGIITVNNKLIIFLKYKNSLIQKN